MFPREVRLLVDTSPLQNAGTGTIQRVLWSQAYEGDLRELSALQVGVADDILSQLRAHVTPQEESLLARPRRPALNPEAYRLYLTQKLVGLRWRNANKDESNLR